MIGGWGGADMIGGLGGAALEFSFPHPPGMSMPGPVDLFVVGRQRVLSTHLPGQPNTHRGSKLSLHSCTASFSIITTRLLFFSYVACVLQATSCGAGTRPPTAGGRERSWTLWLCPQVDVILRCCTALQCSAVQCSAVQCSAVHLRAAAVPSCCRPEGFAAAHRAGARCHTSAHIPPTCCLWGATCLRRARPACRGHQGPDS